MRRCSSDCGFQPSVAATTNRQASTAPTPASMFFRKRTCPGTSTNATPWPDGSVVHAKPRSMVRPRRFSSANRSGSMFVSARTSVDLPWSTWPAVATTCIRPTQRVRRRPARRRRGRPCAGRGSCDRRRPGRSRASGVAARNAAVTSPSSATPTDGISTPGNVPPPGHGCALDDDAATERCARCRNSSTATVAMRQNGMRPPSRSR